MKRLALPQATDGGSNAVANFIESAKSHGLAIDEQTMEVATSLIAFYPGLRGQIVTRPDDVIAIRTGKLRIARDLRA